MYEIRASLHHIPTWVGKPDRQFRNQHPPLGQPCKQTGQSKRETVVKVGRTKAEDLFLKPAKYAEVNSRDLNLAESWGQPGDEGKDVIQRNAFNNNFFSSETYGWLHGKAIGEDSTNVRDLQVGQLNLGNQVRGAEHYHNLN